MVMQTSCLLKLRGLSHTRRMTKAKKRTRQKNYFDRGIRMLPCLRGGDIVRLGEAGQRKAKA